MTRTVVAVLLFDGKAFMPAATASHSNFASASACGEERDGLAASVVELLARSRVGREGTLCLVPRRASLLVQVSRTPFFQARNIDGEAHPWAVRIAGGHWFPTEAVSRYWTARPLTWIARHSGDWLVVMGKKLLTLWKAFEIPDNHHYPFMRAHFYPCSARC
jgi:hypothetical protein